MMRPVRTLGLLAGLAIGLLRAPFSSSRGNGVTGGTDDRAGASIFTRIPGWLYTVALVLFAQAVLGFLVAASGVVSIKASSGHLPPTAWFLNFSMQRSVSLHAAMLDVTGPDLSDPALILKGAGHYETACRPCHGSPDQHKPRVAAAMTPHPPYLPDELHHWEPKELFYIVKHGVKFTGMPGWPTQVRDDEVWAMVAFLERFRNLDANGYRRYISEEPQPGAAPMEQLAGVEQIGIDVNQECGRCHGSDGGGRGAGAFPKLAGQRPEYLLAALNAYARSDRHSGVMEPLAASLSPEQRRHLAMHYARMSAPLRQGRVSGDRRRGRQIAEQGLEQLRVPACSACHGPSTAVRNTHYPNLAGQYADYIILQLELFKKQHRGGSRYHHLMHPVAVRLTEEMMRDVAAYYASLPTESRPSSSPGWTSPSQ
jgi:cytochrome c553